MNARLGVAIVACCVIGAVALVAGELVPRAAFAAGGTITTIAGGGVGDGGPAVGANTDQPEGVAVDGSGTIYIADTLNCRIRKATAGTITTIAGDGICGYGGDGGTATSARLQNPSGVALDNAGNVYVADNGNCRVRKVSGGTITTVAGNGNCDYAGDGGPATSAQLLNPSGVAVDIAGNLYIADNGNCRVRKVTGSTITTVAGNGFCDFAGDGGPATSANLLNPTGVAVDSAGGLYITDTGNCRVREVNGTTITTIAGNGTCDYSGDGGAATSAELSDPTGVTLDAAGGVLIADTLNCRVRRIDAGTITTVAGNGMCFHYFDSTQVNQPQGVAADASGNIYIADTLSCLIGRVNASTMTIVAGGSCTFSGDGGAATSASLFGPRDVAVNGAGDIYIADTRNCHIRKVTNGTITAAPNIPLQVPCQPQSVAFDSTGNLYVATSYIVPSSCATFELNGGLYPDVLGPFCGGVAVDGAGNVYVADTLNCRVREVTGGTITTIAGNGTCSYGGDGGLATSAGLSNVSDVAVDGSGNVYIADTSNCRIRKVSGTAITTMAGNGTCAYGGDGGLATSASLSNVSGVALDGSGNLYIADTANCRIRKIHLGTITTVAGNGICAFGGDGGQATDANLLGPIGLAVDGAGHLLIADGGNNRIREVVFAPPDVVLGGVDYAPPSAAAPPWSSYVWLLGVFAGVVVAALSAIGGSRSLTRILRHGSS